MAAKVTVTWPVEPGGTTPRSASRLNVPPASASICHSLATSLWFSMYKTFATVQ
jgi:hypothetical protein